MKDQIKTKRLLIDELTQMHRVVVESEAAETERLQVEEAVQESEEKYRSLVESTEDSVYLVDKKGTYRFVNKRYRARLGLPEDQVIGKPYDEFHSEKKTREFAEKLKRVFETSGPVQYEHTSERDDHSFLRTLSPVKDQEGQMTAVTVISKDITERKRAEEALRESEKKYSTLMEEALIGICHVDIKGKIIYANKTILQGTGYSSEELIGKNAFRLGLIPHETLKLLGRRMKEKLMGKPPSPLEIQFKRKDGKWIWLEIRGRLLSKHGVPVGVQIIGEDITERKQAELEVQRRAAQTALAYEVGQRVSSKLELDDLLSEIVAAVCDAFDYYGVMILLVDDKAEGLTLQSIAGGYAGIFPKDLWLAIGVGMIGYSAASGQTQVSGDISKDPHYVRKAEEETKSELAIPVKSGQKVVGVLDIQDDEFDAFDETDVMTMETLADEVGVAIENARLYEDIRKELTQRKLAEERLKESEERYRSLVEAGSQMGEAIVLLQNTDKLEAAHLFANEEWARITGYTPGELREMSYLDLVHPRYRGAVAERLRQRWQGEILPGPWEIAIVAKDGTEVPVEAAGSPVMYRDKPAVVGYVRDITERKLAEERLAHLNAVLHSIRKVNQLITTERDRDILLKGICVGLTETRSYFNAWIALLDDSGGHVTSFEAGLGKDFSPMVERLKRGELTACGQKALAQPEPDVVVTGDPLSACGECALSKMYAGKGGMSIRLECAGRVYGLLSASVPAALVTDEEERGLFKEVAEDIAFALHAIEVEEERKQAEEELRKVNQYLESIVDNANVWLDVVDEDTNIVLWNKAAEEISGYSRDEVLGSAKVWEWLYPDESYLRDVLDAAAVYGRESYVDDETTIRTKDGQTKVISWNERKLLDKGGKSVGSTAIGRDVTEQKRAAERLQQVLEGTIQAVGLTTETRDPYTAGHQRRVTQLACAVAREIGLSEEQVESIRVAGLVHDIGKMSVPAEILSKPSRLTEIEFDLIKAHPQVAYDILATIEFPWPVAQIVLQHHERMDGSGYPQGLKAEEIMIEARLLSVADVVEAMASHRPYRPALGIDKALEEITQNKGALYDSEVVDACLRLFAEGRFEFQE